MGANDDDDDDDDDDEGRFGCRRFTLTRARLIPLLLLRIALRRVARADASCSIARPTAGCSNERRKEGRNERTNGVGRGRDIADGRVERAR